MSISPLIRKTSALICIGWIFASAFLGIGCAVDGFPGISATVYPAPMMTPYYSPFPSFYGGGGFYGCGWRGGHGWHGGHCH